MKTLFTLTAALLLAPLAASAAEGTPDGSATGKPSSKNSSTATLTYRLGSKSGPTTIQAGPNGLLAWIRKGVLPSGSILRSVSVDATLEEKIQDDHAARYLTVLIDPSPEDAHVDNSGSLQVGGFWPVGSVHVPFDHGGSNIGDKVHETKTADAWPSLGRIDLSTHQVAIGNMYNLAAGWSGTVTIEYDGPGNDIATFGFPGHSGVVTSSPAGNVIAVNLPYGTALSNIVPEFVMCEGATCRKKADNTPVVSGVTPIDFSTPVVLTVTSRNGISKDYMVSVRAPASTACVMTGFHSNLTGSRVTVMPSGNVVVHVPAATTDAQLATLSPVLDLSPGATCAIPSPALSLTKTTRYTVKAQDGSTTNDYSVGVVANADDFQLFVVKTEKTGLSAADYDYLSLIPVSRHANKGMPAIITIANESDFATNIYLQDYLRRYRPSQIHTVHFEANVPNFPSTPLKAAGPLELSFAMATRHWKSSSTVVLVSDAVDAANYPNVLQASSLAAALDAPLIYDSSDPGKEALVRKAITQLGATEVVYVNAAGTKPAMAQRVLTNPATIVNYLAARKIKVDYLAVTNPKDLSLVSGAKLSLVAPFIAARRNGIAVPITSYEPLPNSVEMFHYTGYPAIREELQELYQNIGRHPAYLALVGNATSIPLAYREPNEQAGNYNASPADLDYANVDADVFPDIAIGRIMAYDIFDSSLLTSRISTYEHLFDGVWEKNMADVGGQWNSAYQDAQGANYGFQSTDLVGRLRPDQALEASLIGHNDHSSYHDVGGAFGLGSVNVLAPAVILSNGCATAAIDFETLIESHDEATGWKITDRGSGALVINQLFKLGAVAFLGSTRSDTGAGKIKQSGAVNALLEGQSLGRGYMAGVDTQSWNGADGQRWNWILMGDPALKIHVPTAPKVTPANHVVTRVSSDTDTLTVQVPKTLFASEVDRSWCSHWGLTYPQYWGDKAGLYGMDVDRFYLVRFTPPRTVLKVEEMDVWPTVKTWVWGDVKLGMMGQPAIDHHQDGTHQLVWAIRANIMAWPASGSKTPLAAMTTNRYRITYDRNPKRPSDPTQTTPDP